MHPILVAIVVALAAILGIPIYTFLDKGNVLRTFDPKNQAGCQVLHRDIARECEDIAWFRPAGVAILACGNPEARKQWFPPAGKRNISEIRPDEMFVYSVETNTLKRLEIHGLQSEDFRLHGISIFAEPNQYSWFTLGVINHLREGSVVQIFDYHVGNDFITLRNTVAHSLIVAPNDLVMTASDSFYVTNDHAFIAGPLRTIEEYLQLPLGNVVHITNSGKIVRVVADGIVYPNGIAFVEHNNEIWVASSLSAEIRVYRRKRNGSLQQHLRIPLDFMPDNLDVEPSTGHVYIAGHGKAINFILARNDRVPAEWKAKFPLYSHVARVINATGESIFLGRPYVVETLLVDDGKLFQASSVAVADESRGTLLVGQLFGDGIGVCKLNKMKV